MKIFVDTNILLDVLSNRDKFAENSSKIFRLCEIQKLEGYISVLSIANIAYILRKELKHEKLKSVISTLGIIFKIQDLTVEDIKQAANLDFNDYEDAIQATCAKRSNVQFIITRNTKDFENSLIPAIRPEDIC